MTNLGRIAIGGTALALLLACSIALADVAVTPEARLRDGGDGRDWAAYGATYGEQHFSPLQQINRSNVTELGLAWSMDLPPGLSAVQPLAIDGILYFGVGYSIVHAVEAETGKLLWKYDPDTAGATEGRYRKAWGVRGIAWWNGNIYTATVDGRLIALDAKSGKPSWSAQAADYSAGYYITGAPRAFDGKIIIGNAGADFADGCTPPDCPVVRGYVAAYDAKSGKMLWRFYTVPGNPAVDNDETTHMAAKSWAGEWWKKGGGGTVWNAITYDRDFNQMLIGTGNGAPHLHRERSQGKGDNLFLASIVAIDAGTGAYKWHYQVNPGETWDYNNAMDIQLADLPIGGTMRKVAIHAPKNGFVYVIDRKSGKLLSASNWVPATWASGIDMKTGRPLENPAARDLGDKSFIMQPGSMGAHNWQPSAYSPTSGLLYIPTLYNQPSAYERGARPGKREGKPGMEGNGLDLPSAFTMPTQQRSELTAWDPVTQKAVWRLPTPGPFNGGLMATASGLIFQGQVDGRFVAHDSKSGKALWSFLGQTAIIGAPITFLAGGKQYVTVLTGIGASPAVLGPQLSQFGVRYDQPRRVLTFRLGGKARLPKPTPPTPLVFPDDPTFKPDSIKAKRGQLLYTFNCMSCHGLDGVAGGQAPDLRASSVPQSSEAFRTVVVDGVLSSSGMPRIDGLDNITLNDIGHYIRTRAAESRANARAAAAPR
ncbi:PQQ-dependent dehydrogenase, methanol/ethanol family [Sphingobium sp. SCG-1]|uniref:PQQ-dependent dehydrogenase, methanol/ethanol family n=1 Tax=Sphingobium sp. SCG-1 TaxID=2072936 RepID=UPI0011AB46C5|nr:PQQ-dependent dehydrogenase, methanol/ethanol family [Sphingobium sp. SCG-1]